MKLHDRVVATLVTKFKKDFKDGNKRKPTKAECAHFRAELKKLADAEPDDAKTA